MIENIIIENLISNDEYCNRVLPFLKNEYFQSKSKSNILSIIKEHVGKYNKLPTKDELIFELDNKKGLDQKTFEEGLDFLNSLTKKSKSPSIDWLIEQTEKFCKDRAIYNAIIESANLIEKESEEINKIPDLLKDALSISFDQHVGHDYLSMVEQRYKLLHQTNEYKIPFDIKVLNEVTNGGLPKKTLTVISASTGAGKTLFLCHNAARNLLDGKNVLYITLEMSEERISERIDANILNIDINNLSGLSLREYKRRLEKILGECSGRLFIKEYPTASANVSHFRALLNELKLKKDFSPDIIYVDYVNICSSSRYKAGSVNSYQFIKAICEELRGLAIEYNVPVVSATQFNREGVENSDVTLKEISESHGLAMTVDILWAMIRTEELDQQNLVLFKQLKNRFSDIASRLRFVVGINRSKMKLFNSNEEVSMTNKKIVVDGSPRTFSSSSSKKENEMKEKLRKINL